MNAIIICVFILFLNSYKSKSIVVNTTSGLVKGKSLNVLNKPIIQFLNIPYAEPPLGELRFAKTKPLRRRKDGIIDGTKPGFSCIQNVVDQLAVNPVSEDHLMMSEDCLVVNIWAPIVRSTLKPVMLWIYGGGFTSGSIFVTLYNGSVLATYDVVVVSVNYRVGALGFLISDEGETAPGNAGLYDQRMALKWVRKNIHLFGGDKDCITIFGESAGSISLSAHLLSPLSKGLFKRAIMESGSLLIEKIIREVLGVAKDVALNNAKKYAKSLKCPEDNGMVECLRRVEATKFISVFPLIMPTMGTEFLPFNTVEDAFKTGNFNQDMDIIAGFNLDEGSVTSLLVYRLLDMVIKGNKIKQFVKQIKTIFRELNIHNSSELSLYKDNTIPADFTNPLFEALGYLLLKCPTYLFAKRYAQHSSRNQNIFVYYLTYTSYRYSQMGVYHTADLSLVFGTALLDSSASQENKDFTRQIMKYWTDFAKYGKPKNWRKFMSDNREHKSVFEIKILNPKYSDLYSKHTFDTFCEKIWGKVP